jgi:hypothetical protein
MPAMTTTEPIRIECHPPERRRRTETLMCGCCCCCCCCLHTVGGLIGAGIAPAFGRKNRMPILYYYDEEFDVALPSIQKTGVSAVKVFWLISLICAILGALIGLVEGAEGFVVGLVILALVYPAVQLGSAMLVAFWLAVSSRDDKRYQFKQLGKITLGLFLGTVAGILTMVVIGVMLSH